MNDTGFQNDWIGLKSAARAPFDRNELGAAAYAAIGCVPIERSNVTTIVTLRINNPGAAVFGVMVGRSAAGRCRGGKMRATEERDG